MLEKLSEVDRKALAKLLARIDEGIDEFDANPSFAVVQSKLTPIAAQAIDACVRGHLVEMLEKTILKRCQPVLVGSANAEEELRAKKAACEQILKSVEFIPLNEIYRLETRLRAEIRAATYQHLLA